jgi:hypothetical protein
MVRRGHELQTSCKEDLSQFWYKTCRNGRLIAAIRSKEGRSHHIAHTPSRHSFIHSAWETVRHNFQCTISVAVRLQRKANICTFWTNLHFLAVLVECIMMLYLEPGPSFTRIAHCQYFTSRFWRHPPKPSALSLLFQFQRPHIKSRCLHATARLSSVPNSQEFTGRKT